MVHPPPAQHIHNENVCAPKHAKVTVHTLWAFYKAVPFIMHCLEKVSLQSSYVDLDGFIDYRVSISLGGNVKDATTMVYLDVIAAVYARF